MKNFLPFCLAASLAVAVGPVGAAQLKFTVTPQADGNDVPTFAKVALPADLADVPPEQVRITMKSAGATTPGQIARHEGAGTFIAWILPRAVAGRAQQWTATLEKGTAKGGFRFKDTPGKHLDLLLDGRPVTRYMYERDKSTKERNFDTAKVYHHVFNEDGSATITKGPGGLYPHHRGIFLGYKVTYDGKKRGDWWHVRNVAQEHRKFLEMTAGPVFAACTVLVEWVDGAGTVVVREERTTIVYRQPPPTLLLLDFYSKLTPVVSDGEFGGDPEHAGVQFRPRNEVNRKATRYLFPEAGITTANVKQKVDLPWAAECFELDGRKYSVQHINHPGNPKGTKYSAYRDYGRFGAYAKAPAKKDRPLVLQYRIWAAPGEMPSRQACARRCAAFVTPPKVEPAK